MEMSPEIAAQSNEADREQSASSDANLAGIALVASLAGMIILLLTEIWSLTAATVWAIVGLLHLPMVATVATGLVFSTAALWASWKTIRLAISRRNYTAE